MFLWLIYLEKILWQTYTFMYVHQVRPSQQDSWETVPPESTLSELNKWFYGDPATSWGYNYLFWFIWWCIIHNKVIVFLLLMFCEILSLYYSSSSMFKKHYNWNNKKFDCDKVWLKIPSTSHVDFISRSVVFFFSSVFLLR